MGTQLPTAAFPHFQTMPIVAKRLGTAELLLGLVYKLQAHVVLKTAKSSL